MVAPELVVYEVANTIWKHEHILRDLEDGESYLSLFYGLLNSGRITTLSPSADLMRESYAIAGRNRIPIYDAVFISLALKLGVDLRTYDRVQKRALNAESELKHSQGRLRRQTD